MLLKGAEIIIECLKEQGTDTIFGYPGGTVISVYDALFTRGQGIRHILTSHEQGAAHAADGYARATGRTGVCLVTSGPGATNLVTGIATAYMDSVPMVALTINVSTASLGKDSFQEVDIAGVTMPVTKHNFIVRDISALADTIRKAFRIASTGRPGPVLVDITRDVAEGTCDYEQAGMNAARSTCAAPDCQLCAEDRRPCEVSPEDIIRAADLIASAWRPVLLVGGGAVISKASAAVRRFCDMTGCPVTDTLMGKGVYPGTGELYIGMAGIYGKAAANHALAHADLIIALGCRFSERVTGTDEGISQAAHIIQIDIDRAELNKNVMSEIGLTGDAGEILNAVCDRLASPGVYRLRKHPKWIEELTAVGLEKDGPWKKVLLDAARLYPDGPADSELDGPGVVRTVYGMTGGDARIVCEVGLNQMWTARNFLYTEPGQLLTSGGLGTMGYGLGAAIGAAIGDPGRRVVNIAGDGCFRMNMNELLTAVRYKVPVIEVILDNRMLGMVHDMQEAGYEGRFCETEFHDGADYAAIAAAMGARSCRARTFRELENALKQAFAADGPYVISCDI